MYWKLMLGEKYVGKQLRGQLKIKVNELDISMLLCVLFYFFSCQLLFLNLFLLFLFFLIKTISLVLDLYFDCH